MDKSTDKEKSSRNYKEDRDDRDRHRDRHRTRDDDEYELRHRSDDHRHHRSRSDRDSRRESSYDDRDEVDERSRSRSYKRKDRGGSEEKLEGTTDKKLRVSDGTKDRRRYDEDKADVVKSDDVRKEERRERRKFGDKVKQERGFDEVSDAKHLVRDDTKVKNEVVDGVANNAPSNAVLNGSGGGTVAKGAAVEPLNMASKTVSSLDPSHFHHTKVSSIYTTNENKGVSITGSHAVPGKSSTDGTSSTAGKTGNLSLDALAKAKKALQMQKELSEKMKKIPLLNKGASSKQDGGSLVGSKAPSFAGETPRASTLHGTAAAPTSSIAVLTTPNIEAVKRAQELAAKMGFRQDPEFAPIINMFPGQVAVDVPNLLKPSKAPVLRLDALGREVDEHGNVVNLTKPSNLSTLKVNINKQKQEAFQILKPELEVDPESNHHFDERMGINKSKLLRPKRMTFQFVEEGKWSKDAEMLKLKSHFGEAQAKELKAKQAQLARAKAEPDINPNLIEVSERVYTKEKPKDPIPEIEWWDIPLLKSASYGDIVDGNTDEDKFRMEKITMYIEHPLPIEPPAEPAPPLPQPLMLTKKEQKKLRTQTRQAREKQKQEMIRDGIMPPPKQKVKMSNLMKVLGSEATQDPTRLEMEIRSAAAEREQAHVDRNIARKSTPAERREKKEKKLFDDQSALETTVSVYRINALSDPKIRFKVERNAQQNLLTGCVVASDEVTFVVAEGGIKSIRRYGKLMLKRINWAAVAENEDDDDDEMKPANKCVLVWQGSVAKPSFNKFSYHVFRTEAAARKHLNDAGVEHYWDLAVNAPDE